MAEISFDPEDYLDEVESVDLLEELINRRNFSKLDAIYQILGLKKYHQKKDVLCEIEKLFD